MTIEQHVQHLQFQVHVLFVAWALMLVFVLISILVKPTYNGEVTESDRRRRVQRMTQKEARKAAEEQALNDAIEAAVAKLIQGNGP